jgi:hypothetical protein
MIEQFGDAYRRFRDEVPALIPTRFSAPAVAGSGMNARRLLLTFALAFSLGVLTAVWLLRPPSEVAQTIAGAPAAEQSTAKPDADADDSPAEKPPEEQDDDQSDAKWPDDAGSPEQLLYAQAQMMDDAIGSRRALPASRTCI